MLTVPFIISENQRTIHKNTQEKKKKEKQRLKEFISIIIHLFILYSSRLY